METSFQTSRSKISKIRNRPDFQLKPDAASERAMQVLPPRLQSLLCVLDRELEKERQDLLKVRKQQQKRYDEGEVPQYLKNHPAHFDDWRVAPIQEDILERRVEITGPANNTKMVIQMLNGTPEARADMAMLDFEDSMKPSWSNVVDAVHNVIGAAKGNLRFLQEDPSRETVKEYRLNGCNVSHMMVRVRGLHLDESHVVVNGHPLSAAVFDLATCVFHTADILCRQDKTPKYYVPKVESHLEARWWNKLFSLLERELEFPPGTLRVTFLIETLPAAFEMEEILFEARSRVCGLNGGRWDKIFSDIKTLRNHPDRVLADRGSIDMKRSWMDNYAKRMIKICHRRGAFAMGGMAAFTPGKDEETRKSQVEKVRIDKAREAEIGHDGCWVSHPYFIGVARNEFKSLNQLDVLLEDFPEHPDLLPESTGPRSLTGLRTNVRVSIYYVDGWLKDIGCVAIDNLMEDLATLEISRSQVWQWLHHHVTLDDGGQVDLPRVRQVFEEELERIVNEAKSDEVENLKKSAHIAYQVFTLDRLPDFFSEALQQVAQSQEDQWNQKLAS